ncbi:acylneuraminate cytidylyltransferase family protein [Shewanella sp. 1_MG-2023]|uniref:acylneuraminate cytidylyltransferase family protein n=1 Tax=unclassified Shewanella TaxID=196818 RepID=UPI0026E1C051|nr:MULTISPECIES: acylneuraminate cytidylyltransferase family protein [unclassified Shewanella]MDO6610108.1 acylneuraminate cytidylyltransferase family protein [Shewanella sp. 7_MG-2023]MDO6769750.1 acylneuraminate cytidylyltransferase family protein [Shewanella sp. 2_MG-2023]MDO6792814.1 acylneuraminate cytidylyltransferase family protein [Shewanella sp. 1_MG-2023]
MNIALITARGGSKGLPRKNILPINGVPLIGYTIQAALKSEDISHVFVTTEDDEIKTVSLQFGAKIINRPVELAADNSGSNEVIEHAIEQLITQGLKFDTVILLQPTSPLRTFEHIDEAIKLFNQKGADCVISVFEPSHTPVKAYIEQSDGKITGLFSPSAPYTRRQDLPRSYQPNGAIYVFAVDKFMLHKTIPRENVFPYLMSELQSVDIDTSEDLIHVEQLIKSNKNDKSSI